MKLAVSTYSLWRWCRENGKTLDDAVDVIASLDVPGVEFAEIEIPGIASGRGDQAAKRNRINRAAALRKRAEKRGLAVVSYCVGAELLRPIDAQRAEVERLKREVDVAADLGVPSMRHDITRGFGDNARGLRIARTFDAAVKCVVPAIREVADYAASRSITTSLENHGFFMQESRRVEKLIKAVDHANFALTLDMGNFLCVNENPVVAVKRLARYAVMAHVKDFHVRPGDRTPPAGWFKTPTSIALRGAIVGHGEIDIPAQIGLLRKARYDGFLSLEFEGMEEPLAAVRLGLEYLRTIVT